MTYEGLRLEIQKYERKLFAERRRKMLKNTHFTIISNNCWGGMIYESYGLPKQTPTVGCFFMADDYIRFLTRLEDYINAELTFIAPEDSRWRQEICTDKRYGHYPVGKLTVMSDNGPEDVEIFFLHYQSTAEVKEKWNRRIKRFDKEHMLIKFNDQNKCTRKHIETFERLPFRHKICFSAAPYPHCQSVRTIRLPGNCTYIPTSYEPFGQNRAVNITDLINELFI